MPDPSTPQSPVKPQTLAPPPSLGDPELHRWVHGAWVAAHLERHGRRPPADAADVIGLLLDPGPDAEARLGITADERELFLVAHAGIRAAVATSDPADDREMESILVRFAPSDPRRQARFFRWVILQHLADLEPPPPELRSSQSGI